MQEQTEGLGNDQTYFIARWPDVAQHHQRLLVDALGDQMQAGIRQRDSHILRLRAIDGVTQDPPASLLCVTLISSIGSSECPRNEHTGRVLPQ